MATTVDAKLLRATRFPPEFNQKVDMQKVNLQVMKKWIASSISEILGSEDDVVIELCFNLIDGPRYPDIKALQIQLTGFLDKDTAPFCKELWQLCLSAQSSPQGVPKELLEAKKLELIQEKVRIYSPKLPQLRLKTDRLMPTKLRKKHEPVERSRSDVIASWPRFESESDATVVFAEGAVAEVITGVEAAIEVTEHSMTGEEDSAAGLGGVLRRPADESETHIRQATETDMYRARVAEADRNIDGVAVPPIPSRQDREARPLDHHRVHPVRWVPEIVGDT
ncbi:PWI domain-containing protein [Xylariaceae sp. FL1272]|nr:PWI domain-containing protein [Xylariaceae sp. FL1272]